jgi:hypothetical protein
VVERPLDRHGLAEAAGRPDHEAELELEVEPRGRPEARGALLRRDELPARPDHLRAAHDHGARPPVVADREVAPVGQQRLVPGAQHAAEVRGMVERRVEVREVGDGERQPELDLGDGVHVRLGGGPGARVGQQGGDPLARRAPRFRARGHEDVEAGRRERRRGGREAAHEPRGAQPGEVEHVVADAHPRARATARRAEAAVGQDGRAEGRAVRHGDPGRAGHAPG